MSIADCHIPTAKLRYTKHGTRIAAAWRQCFLGARTVAFFERWYPYLFAVAAGVGCYWLDPKPPKSMVNLLAAVISVASIAVGFLGTAQAIVLSANDTRILRHLRQVGGYNLLLQYLNEAIALSFALAAISAIGLFKDFEKNQWPRLLDSARVFIAVAATFSYIRVTRVFFKILSSPT